MATTDRPEPSPAQPAVRLAMPPAVRAVARVRPQHRDPNRGGVYRQRVPRSYRFVLLTSNPRPVFVDDTGRRGRLLGVASVVLAAIALLLLAAFWLSQTTWPGVEPMPLGTGA